MNNYVASISIFEQCACRASIEIEEQVPLDTPEEYDRLRLIEARNYIAARVDDWRRNHEHFGVGRDE